MAYTELLNETFTGANSAALDVTKWTIAQSTGSANIQSNMLRTAFLNAGNAYGSARTVTTVAPADNPDITWTMGTTTGTAGYFWFAGLTAGAPTSTTGGSFTFSQGVYVRSGVLNMKGSSGTQTQAVSNLGRARIRVEGGTRVLYKTWAVGASEPGTWDVDITLTTAGSITSSLGGYFGIHAPSSGSGMSGNANWDDVSFGNYTTSVDLTFNASAAGTISVSSPDATVTAVDNSNVNNPAVATTIGVSAPAPTVLAQRHVNFQPSAITINVSAGDAGVHAVGNANFTASNAAINVTAPNGYRDVGSVAINVTDDAGIQSSQPNTVQSTTVIAISPDASAPTALYKWKFNTSRENIYKAYLRVKIQGETNANAEWRLYALTSDWDEATVTYNTKPSSTFIGTINLGSIGIGSVNTIEVTGALPAGTYGFGLSSNNGNTQWVYSSENSGSGGEPGVITTYFENNPVNVGFTATVADISVSSPTPTTTVATHVNVNTTSATISVDASGADVFATDTVVFSASYAQIDVTSLDARGGDPNAIIAANAAEITVLAPNGAEAIGGHDEEVFADAIEITTTVPEAVMSNITDVTVQAQAIGVRIKLAGFYNRDEDKWADYIEDSLVFAGGPDPRENYEGYGDRWFRFEEPINSTVAADETGHTGGVYYGNPTLRVEALDTRSAVSLDGIDDFVDINPLLDPSGVTFVTNTPLPLGMSVEFVVRTSATSGTLFSNGRFGLEVTENSLRWTDATPTSGGWTEKFLDIEDAKINDGQWHHIVWLANEGNGRNSLMVDGRIVWSRAAWNNWHPGMPTRVGMREQYYYTNTSTIAIDLPMRPLQGDFMEFIIRERIDYTRDEALRSYYILNNHTLIDAKVADTISISSPGGAKGRGNQKKMLVLYGNAEEENDGNFYNMFYSSWSGMRVPRGPDAGQTNNNPHLLYNLYDNEQRALYPPKPIDYKGYKVYYAHMFEPGRYSSPGIVKNTGEDYFYDNQTGEPRYIDVNKDLAVDVADFDVIHVLHWPGENQQPVDASDNIPYFNSLTEQEYDRLRDLFKKSLRTANDKGVGLWIAEAKMAVEFGIAKSYSVHYAEIESKGNANNYAVQRDAELGRGALEVAGGTVKGEYYDTYFVRNRRIISTATGFSEQPTWYVSERILWQGYDRLKAHPDAYAHNLAYLPDGLTIGTEMTMKTGANWAGSDKYRNETVHYGLDPNGIVGNVIAKEELTFYRGDDEVANQYSNLVTTVLLDKGTILEGQPIGGKIFVELMDNDFAEPTIRHTTQAKQYLNGAGAPSDQTSLWDLDDRRNKELFFYNSSSYFKGDFKINGESIPVINVTDLPVEYMPYYGMNDRGLNWLAIKPALGFGSNQVFAAAVNVTVEAKAPEVQVVKHNTFAATPATVKVEFRKPVGTSDPDVTINADVATIEVIGGNYEKIVYADVVDIGVTTPEPVVVGEGEDYILYLRSDNITLYLGEDN